jgi:hypothetical protein
VVNSFYWCDYLISYSLLVLKLLKENKKLLSLFHPV